MTGFWNLISQTSNYKGYLILGILCNVLMAIFTIVSIPMIIPFFQVLFDRIPEAQSLGSSNVGIVQWFESKFIGLIQTKGKQDALLFVCLSLVAVFFLKNLFRYLAMFFMAPLRNGMIKDIRAKLYKKYLELPLSFHSEEKKGDLLSRITSDIQELDFSILHVIQVIFKAPILILGSLGFMFYISPKLTLFTLLLLFFTALVIGNISKVLKKQSKRAQSNLSAINSVVEESLTGMRVTKGFGAQDFMQSKFDVYNSRYENTLTRLLRRRDLSSPLSEFLGISVVAVLLWYGSNLVFQNQLMPETFFAFVFAFYNVIEPAKSFSAAYYSIQKGMAALERVDEILDIKPDAIASSESKDIVEFKDEIRAKNLSFKYGEDSPMVLDKLSFTIKKGQKVAFVGVSGSGKTTLMDLLIRFFDPVEGSISIDGLDYKSLDVNSLRSLIGVVTQDAILFNDSIENNIRFNREANEDEIKWASDIANANEFINEFPAKYQSNVGDQGVKISGGQKQRLTIARAVLGNPPILILDEATSSLDADAEKKVQLALDNALKDKTAIIISHRLSTIKNADLIFVLEEGRITDQGDHDYLVKNSPIYKRLVQMQTF